MLEFDRRPRPIMPVYDNSSAVFPIAEGAQAAVKWLNKPPQPENLDPNQLLLYRFPYRRRFTRDGRLVSIPTKVWKTKDGEIRWSPRKPNLLEDAGMFMTDHPLGAGGILGTFTGGAIGVAARGEWDKAIVSGALIPLAVTLFGVMRRMEADTEGVPTHMVGLDSQGRRT